MMYLLAILCPPLAVLFVGKPFQALLNLLLTLLFWLPGAIHACMVVADKKADKRSQRQAEYIAKARQGE
ncbi:MULTISPECIES: YqaE/Pmp3 family membrane protein [Alkalihalophilus]|uniref:YqaE/Pmp3 family membrane protein n=1 Tax=Alkalihalophilus pseudofirmus TaxID=79885 RepID=A0AAJ2NJX2_ALKPS|nr:MULTISPECIES: YqaE/Pmp3 family membrane protein [Alkalihalophilus]MDV2883822.1 YqaE/Pmp3 family membrane protein [Alkalihalophilus pseudofirmus]MEC2070327.1 YqaE/Pmp3 family membrane protein [Alkalihalophilus marmarensis]OLS34440.1 proteolipid membrane potential modulator [Alkalihalophilus pseudofirmus]